MGMQGDLLLCAQAVLWVPAVHSVVGDWGPIGGSVWRLCSQSRQPDGFRQRSLRWGDGFCLDVLENRQFGDGCGDAGRSVAVCAGCVVGGDSTAVFGCYWGSSVALCRDCEVTRAVLAFQGEVVSWCLAVL
jgi:hypothetical protein